MMNMNSADMFVGQMKQELIEDEVVLECDDCGEQSTYISCPECYGAECASCNSMVGCVNEFGAPTVVYG